MKRVSLVLVVLAACGGDDGGGMPPRDAAVVDGRVIDGPLTDAGMVDAAPDALQFVNTVACGSEVATVTTTGSGFSGMFTPNAVTINQNEIVKFVMISGSGHNVIPSTTTTTDPGIRVGYGETKCLQFTATGTFGWRCSPHQTMTGTVTVQ